MKFVVKHCLKPELLFSLLFILVLPIPASAQSVRYRGDYTYGHEVNTFCPVINSQCYWLHSATSNQIRQQLKDLSVQHMERPYQSVCVVLQGKIDRETKAGGFAADYDGLIQVNKVFGLCSQTDIVTQGDLQHHRWILESINGVQIDMAQLGHNIDLDFGEKMTVIANTACQKLSGHVVLREQYFSINTTSVIQQPCTTEQKQVEQLISAVLNSESSITVKGKKLILNTANTQLMYQLKDWVY